MTTDQNTNHDLQRDWQSRIVTIDCSHCKFFQRRGSGKFGQCGCEQSKNHNQQVFQDASCDKYSSIY